MDFGVHQHKSCAPPHLPLSPSPISPEFDLSHAFSECDLKLFDRVSGVVVSFRVGVSNQDGGGVAGLPRKLTESSSFRVSEQGSQPPPA
eukprot:1083313-Rhodomonas_salina.4